MGGLLAIEPNNDLYKGSSQNKPSFLLRVGFIRRLLFMK